MNQYGLLPPDIDLDLEARRLHALIDGLALHAVSNNQAVNDDAIRGIMARHLASLTAVHSPRQ